MTLTWFAPSSPRTIGAVGRLLAFCLAAGVCALLALLAFTQRLSAITNFLDDVVSIESVVEFKEPPPVQPPFRPQPPPETQRPTPADDTAVTTPDFSAPSTDAAPPSPPAPIYLNAAFVEQPNGRDFARLYPRRALERGVGGRVVLDCTVAATGRLSCAVGSEDPTGWGFGEASLRAAQQFRVAPATADGRPTSGGRLRVPMSWQLN